MECFKKETFKELYLKKRARENMNRKWRNFN